MNNFNDHLLAPDSHEAPILNLLGKAPDTMTETELIEHIVEVRALRGMAAKRNAATNKAAKTATAKKRGGLDLDKFLSLGTKKEN